MDFIRRTEDKMFHLHRVTDSIRNKPEYQESVTVLNEVLRDYQTLVEKAKDELRDVSMEMDR